jgi:hypothetical protein
LLKELSKNNKKISARVAELRAEIWTQPFPNRKKANQDDVTKDLQYFEADRI